MERFPSGSPYEQRYGFSRAVRSRDRVLVSGTAPIWPDGSCPDDPAMQARRCFEIALTALREAGGDAAHVVRTRMYLVDPDDADAVGEVHSDLFSEVPPTTTMIVVGALLDPRWRVEIELEAEVPQG